MKILELPAAELFESLRSGQLAAMFRDPAEASRMAQAAVHLLADEKVRACEPMSVLGALQKAISMGFRLEQEFGECYLIPRSMTATETIDGKTVKAKKSVCTFQVGYKGWKAKALQSGAVSFLVAETVFTDDVFEFEYGTGQFLKHRPADRRMGKFSHFYAQARTTNGADVFRVINFQDAEASRRYTETEYEWNGGTKTFIEKPKPGGLWAKHYGAMALRVPIKRVCAALPLTAGIEAAIQADGGAFYLQKDGTVTTITPAEVEAQADHQVEGEAVTVPEEIDRDFYDVQAALLGFDKFKEVYDLWAAQDPESKAMQFRPYVQNFYTAAGELATSRNEVVAFMKKVPVFWQRDFDLKNILTDRLKVIEDAQR